jgi:hypothetical protein
MTAHGIDLLQGRRGPGFVLFSQGMIVLGRKFPKLKIEIEVAERIIQGVALSDERVQLTGRRGRSLFPRRDKERIGDESNDPGHQ